MTRIEALKIITTARAAGKIPDLRGAKGKNVTWPFFISGDADLKGAK